MRRFFIFSFLLTAITIYGQKPPLDHSVYDSWKSVSQTLISDNGEWTAYAINPQQGDGWLYINNNQTGKKDSASRGTAPVFSPDCRYIAFQVIPSYAETRQAKKKKLKEDQMPKNSLEIRILPGNEIISIPGIKSFALPSEKSNWMAYLLEKKISEKQPADSVKTKKEYPDVTEYVVAENGRSISFIQDFPDTTKIDNFKVTIFDVASETLKVIFDGKGDAKKISTDKSGNYTSFIYSSDTSKVKVYSLYLSKSFNNATAIVDTASKAMPAGWSVSENGSHMFSDDGTRLYFGTAPKPVKEPEDTLL
ncbi:MAG: hypothetical protein H6Q23_2194, partial [Bacteroidetes bacterium]|nr:hypothetical protein [Bacteroidota bacterium]